MPAENEMVDKCGLCGSEASKKCSACRQESYCSKEHQQKHWKIHKSACRPFLVSLSYGFVCLLNLVDVL